MPLSIWICRSNKKLLAALFIFGVLFMLNSILTATSDASAQRREDLHRIFARPLIVGASVSGGLLAKSPGDVATELVMGADTAVNIAGNGYMARDLSHIDAQQLADYSLVIGVDFLFWDSTLTDVADSIASLKNLIRSGYRAGRPVLIGDVPMLIEDQKPESVTALNRVLYSACKPQRRCYVLPLDGLHRRATGPGIVIGEYTYRFSDLTVDGLHLNAIGSDYVARVILKILAK